MRISVSAITFAKVAAVWLLSSQSASARLGETADECAKRYGPPVEIKPSTLPGGDSEMQIFSKSGISISVQYRNGVAWKIQFRRSTAFSFAELDALLAANASGKVWSTPFTSGASEYRMLDGESCLAIISSDATKRPVGLTLVTRDSAKANRQRFLRREMTKKVEGGANKSLPGF